MPVPSGDGPGAQIYNPHTGEVYDPTTGEYTQVTDNPQTDRDEGKPGKPGKPGSNPSPGDPGFDSQLSGPPIPTGADMHRRFSHVEPGDRISSVLVQRQGLNLEVKEAVTAASLSLGMDQVTEMSLTFVDPGFKILRSGIFGTPPHLVVGEETSVVTEVDEDGEEKDDEDDGSADTTEGANLDSSGLRTLITYEGLSLEVSNIDIDGGPHGRGQLTVKARSKGVGDLKRLIGPKVMKNASPSDFVGAECEEVGLTCYAQESETRPRISRDVARKGEQFGNNRPSSWSTFTRLADEIGFKVFEVAGVLYFGKPSWLITQAFGVINVDWLTKDTTMWPVETPNMQFSTDNEVNWNANLEMPLVRSGEFRPGRVVIFDGIEFFKGLYICNTVDYSLLGGNLAVTIQNPVDPEPSLGPKRKKGGGGGSASAGGVGGLKPGNYDGTHLDQGQINIVKTILQAGIDEKCDDAALLCILMCGYVESTFHNYPGGDGTSRGVFQQANSSWGTTEAITDPYRSCLSFLGREKTATAEGLLDINYANGYSDLGQAVYDIQACAAQYAYRYQANIGIARAILSAMTVTAGSGATGPIGPKGAKAVVWYKDHRHSNPNGGDWYRMCQSAVRQAFLHNGIYNSAADAWAGGIQRRNTPIGDIPAAVPVFFNTGGEYGHVALSIGGGRCISNDFKRQGWLDECGIKELADGWGAPVLGWTEDDSGIMVLGK